MPPVVVLGNGVAQDPDRNCSADGVVAPPLDQLPAVDIGQLEVDQDENGAPTSGEAVGLLAGAHVLDRHAITATLHHIQIGDVGVVFNQEYPSLTRHTATLDDEGG